MLPNKPDGADRRRPLRFREPGGEAGVVGITAAAGHLERWVAKLIMRNTVIHLLLAVSLSISVHAQMASGVFSMASPKLRQFLTGHREASQMMSNVVSEAFSNRTVRLHYFYSEDESVARARHYYPDESS